MGLQALKCINWSADSLKPDVRPNTRPGCPLLKISLIYLLIIERSVLFVCKYYWRTDAAGATNYGKLSKECSSCLLQILLDNEMQQSQWNLIAILSNSTLFDFTHNMRAQIISPVSLNHEPRKTCWRLQIFSTKLKLVSFYGIQETFGNIWLTGRGVLFSVRSGLNTSTTTLC